jgi:hypothetical protein
LCEHGSPESARPSPFRRRENEARSREELGKGKARRNDAGFEEFFSKLLAIGAEAVEAYYLRLF